MYKTPDNKKWKKFGLVRDASSGNENEATGDKQNPSGTDQLFHRFASGKFETRL